MIVYFSRRSTEQQVINLTCASASVAEANHFITCEKYVFGRLLHERRGPIFPPKLVNTQDANWYEKVRRQHNQVETLARAGVTTVVSCQGCQYAYSVANGQKANAV